MSNSCSITNCDLAVLDNNDKCALHCKKNNYQADSYNNTLQIFYNQLIDYIINSLFQNPDIENRFSKENIKFILKKESADTEDENEIILILKKQVIVMKDISFPERKGRDYFDYFKLLRKFKGVHFDTCKFYLNDLSIHGVMFFFQDCEFYNYWNLYNLQILDDLYENFLYQNCKFNESIYSSPLEDNDILILNNPLFSDCYFNQIRFEKTKFVKEIFNDTYKREVEIKEYKIESCIIEEKMILNNYKIDNFSCINSVFKSKFEFKENTVNILKIENSNFSKLVDCFSSKFSKFNIVKSIFNDFVGFENCRYGSTKNSKNPEYLSSFKYVTFRSFVNFRSTSFYCGLDINNINLIQSPNFLNTEIDFHNTERETFRVVKHSFDQIGNLVEANKFFVLEMKKLNSELCFKKHPEDWIIFKINTIFSNFGQSYFRPFIWLVILSALYFLIYLGFLNNYLYKIYLPSNSFFATISNLLNTFAKSILPFNKILIKDFEFISLTFYISFSILIYLIIIAVKRHTKR